MAATGVILLIEVEKSLETGEDGRRREGGRKRGRKRGCGEPGENFKWVTPKEPKYNQFKGNKSRLVIRVGNNKLRASKKCS